MSELKYHCTIGRLRR